MSAVLNGASSISVRGLKYIFLWLLIMWLMNDHEYLNEGVGLVCYSMLHVVQLRREQRSLGVLKAVAIASLRALQRVKSVLRWVG